MELSKTIQARPNEDKCLAQRPGDELGHTRIQSYQQFNRPTLPDAVPTGNRSVVEEDPWQIAAEQDAPNGSCAVATFNCPSTTAAAGSAKPANYDGNFCAAIGQRHAVVEADRYQEGPIAFAKNLHGCEVQRSGATMTIKNCRVSRIFEKRDRQPARDSVMMRLGEMLDGKASTRPVARSMTQNDPPRIDFSLIQSSRMNHPESNSSRCHPCPSPAVAGPMTSVAMRSALSLVIISRNLPVRGEVDGIRI